ncbi:adenine deaminase [Runella salmonicolor]|uniref:Adenine deaminase n=1 Tax=Runella salmonicolor TaxID=2950278 RepID=A0ABT1FU46_9BACT|nr:adenine deaminase [Runella salmonicolor]MCP1385285.1 adenine deaminase [Runella salmonicolor]
MLFTANLLNLFDHTIGKAEIEVAEKRIISIKIIGAEEPELPYIMPGFVDAHVHIESSMLTPAQFARLAVVHGTVATVSDPHEIGNVLGVAGVEYMIEDSKRVPFKFCFGAPSCVPATTFETAGAVISAKDVRRLLAMKEIGYLAEMMNFPGVLHEDPDVMMKIRLAQAFNKPVDGHAPGLRGADAQKYIEAGITTDHECFTYDEALDKLQLGLDYILIREGSAAKNFEALIPLIADFPNRLMFCSDDKHPDNLVEGHINQLVKRALAKGYPLFSVLRAACLNPVLHYRLNVGLLREGDPADFILVNNLQDFDILETYIEGEKVSQNGSSNIPDLRSPLVNQFDCKFLQATDLKIEATSSSLTLNVIEALDGQLITNQLEVPALIQNGLIVSDTARDILKIVVVNRYHPAPVAVGFIKNIGLEEGAIASSVAHDSHNIIAVGCDDESLVQAINLVIEAQGGVSAVSQKAGAAHLLPLPIAGLMSDVDGYKVAEQYTQIDFFVKSQLGSKLNSPFMTLSFMGLLVIPSLKMSDLGLFDGQSFSFTKLYF